VLTLSGFEAGLMSSELLVFSYSRLLASIEFYRYYLNTIFHFTDLSFETVATMKDLGMAVRNVSYFK
jgi:hypothetical protein